ncbi:AsmA family protein [Pedobacter sp. AW31-3R]|uniref:AsmA family protein n=1 Tax=Pedobacter sp. AW31-3R TaxID=3445781 RepID=UPI003FA1769B
MPRWLKLSLKIFAALVILIVLAFTGVALYVNANKKELLVSITKELNKNLNGSMTVEVMEPTFLKGFPGVSVKLKNVEMRDSLWNKHHHSFLTAKDFDISVNTLALLKGTIEIRRISITDAEVYLFTDSNGYSNTSIFRKNPDKKEKTTEESSSPAEIRRFDLNNVRFILDNRKGNKLFLFAVQDFNGKIDYPSDGWHADIRLKTLVRSLAFNTKRGSFIKDKLLEGTMEAVYDGEKETIELKPNILNIGDDPFMLSARFDIGKAPVEFSINVGAEKIMWRNASALLAPNITSRLNMFNLDKPIAVNARIAGNMGAGGDPSILVTAAVRSSQLTNPGGTVDDCSFDGIFTNNFINGKGLTDENSAIKLFNFKGKYAEMPFTIDTAFIHNLDKPVATGTFKSKFEVAKLNNVLGDDLLKFSKGAADLELHYRADIVDLKLTKPMITGVVNVKNADVSYVPRGLNFKNTSISLNFTKEDLLIRDIHLQSGKSIVYMSGSVKNFLNLYYNAPEKSILKWEIRSPQLYLGEFIGFLGARKQAKVRQSKSSKSSNFARQLNTMLDKGRVELSMRVDQLNYNKFKGTNATAEISLSDAGIDLKNVSLKNGGGFVKLNGQISQIAASNHFKFSTVISNVDVKNFFYSFDNFGLKGLSYKNLRGSFFTKANISGNISNQGKVVPGSMNGKIVFDLKKGALLNYDAIKNVGKFAFPFRDLDNITFSNLNGDLDIRGQKIIINPMLINSSVLNMNIEGVYAMNKGTNILLDVPLRNPKKDEDITSKKEIRERRMKGIVVHIQAVDGDDGKIKFKLIRNRNKDKKEEDAS